MASATSSLPTPLSPRMRTVASLFATVLTISSTPFIAFDPPTIRGVPSTSSNFFSGRFMAMNGDSVGLTRGVTVCYANVWKILLFLRPCRFVSKASNLRRSSRRQCNDSQDESAAGERPPRRNLVQEPGRRRDSVHWLQGSDDAGEPRGHLF